MASIVESYHLTLCVLASLSVLYLILFGVADIAQIRAKHVPGAPHTGDHNVFMFRAARAHANFLENLAPFALVSGLAMLLGVPSEWTNGVAVVFLGARVAHMITYYMNLQALRSACFAVGFIATAALTMRVCLAL